MSKGRFAEEIEQEAARHVVDREFNVTDVDKRLGIHGTGIESLL